MSDYDYYYYELSKSIVSEVETLLLRAHRSDIRLVSGGSKFQPLSVTSHAKKISTAGFLLTADEKAKLDKNAKLREVVGLDRAHIITTSDELILLLETELGESLTKGMIEPHSVSTFKEPIDVVSVESPSHPTPSPQVSSNVSVELTSSDVESSETMAASKPIETERPTSVEVPLNVTVTDDGFGLTIEEENQVLRAENASLRRDLERAAKTPQVLTGVSEEELNNLRADLIQITEELNTEKAAHEKTKGTLTLVDADFETKKSDYNRLLVEYDDLKAELKSSNSLALTPLHVPDNVSIYITASALDLVPSYQYLLLNMKDTLLVDLSPESIMDTLVRITKRNRVGKWLLGEQNIRALYSPYDEIKLKVADGLELLTSPNALLPVNFLSEVDWERKFDDLSRLNCKVVLFLGLETNRGVFEFLNRLDKQAKVLRSSSPLSERSWSRVVRQHEGSVEEVSI
jgi:hypothetical protein